MSGDFPKYGYCDKCGTNNSLLFDYRKGYFICKANGCYEEEMERDGKRHVILNRQLEDYRKLIARSQG